MRRRKLPKAWLFTDERLGDRLFDAIRALPAGGGIVFRHYSLPRPERMALARRVAAAARSRGLLLLIAGPPLPVRGDGRHLPRWLPSGRSRNLVSRSVHSPAEATRARREGVDLVFVSPVFPTRSHPGAPVLGRLGFSRLAALATKPAIALGGVDSMAMRRLPADGFAAIGAWLAMD